jgi:hypothetical protein
MAQKIYKTIGLIGIVFVVFATMSTLIQWATAYF